MGILSTSSATVQSMESTDAVNILYMQARQSMSDLTVR